MDLLKDEELFGMIPKRDGSHIPGNATAPMCSFREAYHQALSYRGAFSKDVRAESFLYAPGWDEWKDVERRAANRLRPAVESAYKKAFPIVDQAIEEHLEKTNGYIESFPPLKVDVYEEPVDYPFSYFGMAPDDYSPPAEKELSKAYNAVHRDSDPPLHWSIFWVLMATLAMALLIIDRRIYGMFPQLSAWITANDRNSIIYLVCLCGFLVTTGWIAMASWLEVDWSRYFPAYLMMIGAISFWGFCYFTPVSAQIVTEGFGNAVKNVLIRWPFRIYFGIIWLVYLFKAIGDFDDIRSYRKNYRQYRETYIRIYEEDINKLHRYLRLRQLWRAHEGESDASWIRSLNRRLSAYHEEYAHLCRNRQ